MAEGPDFPVGPATPAPAPAPARPRVWTVGLACAALFLGMAAITGTAFLVDALRPGRLPDVPGTPGEPFDLAFPGLLAVAAASSTWIALVALLGAAFSPEFPRRRLGLLAPRLEGAGAWAAAIGGGLALSHAFDLALRLSGAGRGLSLEVILGALEGVGPVQALLALLVLGLGAGFAEELFFRGYVQRRLVARFGAAPAVVAASALFALAHLDPQHSAFAFAFGIYLGLVAMWTGSTWPAIAIHTVNNAVSVVLVASGLHDADAGLSPAVSALLLVALAGLAGACAAFVLRRARAASAAAEATAVDGPPSLP
jgi:membrane protease YdiL (CAAX protease family)